MNIFLANNIPRKSYAGTLSWIPKKNWAVTIDGRTYYGARSKEDLEKAMVPQPYQPYYKRILDYYTDHTYDNVRAT